MMPSLKDKCNYDVTVISQILYAILPDGAPEFTIAVQVEIEGHKYIYPLTLESIDNGVPAVGKTITARYHERFYLGRYSKVPNADGVEARFGL